MVAKKKAKKKAKPRPAIKSHVSKKILPAQVKEIKGLAALPPIEKELVEEEETTKKKDEFFNEEDMKEFSVKDEEEDIEDDSGEGGEGEPAWNDEEF